jgi:hypothetical protein
MLMRSLNKVRWDGGEAGSNRHLQCKVDSAIKINYSGLCNPTFWYRLLGVSRRILGKSLGSGIRLRLRIVLETGRNMAPTIQNMVLGAKTTDVFH